MTYEQDGFKKDFVLIDDGNHIEVSEKYVRTWSNKYYADIVVNDTIYLGEWSEDDERYIVYVC